MSTPSMSDYEWEQVLHTLRQRLNDKSEASITLSSLCSAEESRKAFWEAMEARWREDEQPDFDYRGSGQRDDGTPEEVLLWRRR